MAEGQNSENQPSVASKRSRRPSKDTLNLIIAVSAVLISAASFVAAYMQSDAAYRQVKAETWPFLQLENGNIDDDSNEQAVYLRIENVGVGPAKIENFVLTFKDREVHDLGDLLRACCLEEAKGAEAKSMPISAVTNSVAPTILPAGGGDIKLFKVPYEGNDRALWHALNEVRRELRATSCYCSLLGDCYETDFASEPVEVDACTRRDKRGFTG